MKSKMLSQPYVSLRSMSTLEQIKLLRRGLTYKNVSDKT